MRHAVFALFIITWPAYVLAQTAPEPAQLLQGMEWVMTGEYARAMQVFASMEKEYPDHPAGAFFSAAALQSQMLDYESNRWRREFHFKIKKALKLAKTRLDAGDADPWIRFYYGAGKAYQSYQLARDKKYFAAIKAAMASANILQAIIEADSSFYDAYLGLGNYQYWRSHATEKLDWLPMFPDRKLEGTGNILRAYRHARLSRWAALSSLCWIAIQEAQYELACGYAEQGLQQFPQSRFYLWPMAEAQFKQQHWAAAAEAFGRLLQSVRRESFNNGYNELVLNWKLAQCYMGMKQTEKARSCAQQVLTILPDAEVAKPVDDKKRAAAKLLKSLLHPEDARDLPAQD